MKKILLLLLLTGFTCISAKDKGLKYLEKQDRFYTSGDYFRALKINEKLMDYYQKHSFFRGNQGLTYIYRAKINEGLARFDEIEKDIEKGLSIIEMAEGKTSDTYALGLCRAGEVFALSGNFTKAEKYITPGYKLMLQASPAKQGYLAEAHLLYTQLLFWRGFYYDALKEIPKLRSEFKPLIKRTVTIVDDKGNAIEEKLKKKWYLSKKRDYADVLNLEAEIYVYHGNYNAADSALKIAENYIDEEIHKRDISAVYNQFLRGLYYDNLTETKKAAENYDDAIEDCFRTKYGYKYKRTSKVYEQIFDYYYLTLLTLDDKKYNNLKNNYHPDIIKYHDKDNLYYGYKELDEAFKDYYRGKLERAKKDLVELENSEMIPEFHYKKPTLYYFLFDINQQFGLYEEATYYLDKFIGYQAEYLGKNSPVYHYSRTHKAIFDVHYANDFTDAELIFENSFMGVMSKEYHPMHFDYLNIINNYAELLMQKDRFEDAINILNNAVEIAEKYYGKKHSHTAIAYEYLGSALMEAGQYSKAREALSTSLDIFKKEDKTHPYHAVCLRTVAKYYLLTGFFDLAKDKLDEAKKLTTEEANLEDFADYYVRRGDYSKVESALTQSIEFKTKAYGTAHRQLIKPYIKLAELYFITGDYTRAEKNIQTAMNISRSTIGQKTLLYAQALDLHGKYYRAIGDYDNAIDNFNQCIETRKEIYGTEEHIMVAKSMAELAKAMQRNKAPAGKIEKIFDKAHEIVKTNLGSNNPTYAEIMESKAEFFISQNKLQAADILLNKANDIWTNKSKLGKNNKNSANIILLRGLIAQKQKKYKEAIDHLEDAQSRLKKVFGDEQHEDYLYTISRLAQVYYIMGDKKRAIKMLDETTEAYLIYLREIFPDLSEREKNKFWHKIDGDFEFYKTVALDNYKEDESLLENVYNQVLTTKAILLNSSKKVRQRILNSGDPVLIDQYNELIGKKEAKIAALSMDAEQRKESGIDLHEIDRDIELMERSLSQSSELFSRDRKNEIEWKDVQKSLKENEYAIEIIRFNYFDEEFTDSVVYAALILSPETKKTPELVVFENGHLFETRYLKYYRNSMRFSVKDKYSYEAFWKPIDDVVKDNSNVFLSGEGVYNQINLESIPTPDGRYVLDKQKITLLSNTKDIVAYREGKQKETDISKLRAVLIGNPVYYKILDRKDSIRITENDQIYAREKDRVIIEEKDKILATENRNILIKTEDQIIATPADNILIATEDSILARLEDKIYITKSDSVFDAALNRFITISDSMPATLKHDIYITTEDNIIARQYHERVIKTSDNIIARAYHGKYITEDDHVYAQLEDKIFIEEKDNIINEALYRELAISQLEGAEKEIEELNKLLSGKRCETNMMLYADASESKLKEIQNPGILHIATHGFFKEDKKEEDDFAELTRSSGFQNPLLNTGVLLKYAGDIFNKSNYDFNIEPGILTAYEAMNQNYDETELVVLSACETGKGQVQIGEGVAGLQRAFLVAGAKVIIMSLFKVADDATRDLMSEFYKNWLETNNKHDSFIEAKKTIREKYKDPIYWGAFVMIGME